MIIIGGKAHRPFGLPYLVYKLRSYLHDVSSLVGSTSQFPLVAMYFFGIRCLGVRQHMHRQTLIERLWVALATEIDHTTLSGRGPLVVHCSDAWSCCHCRCYCHLQVFSRWTRPVRTGTAAEDREGRPGFWSWEPTKRQVGGAREPK